MKNLFNTLMLCVLTFAAKAQLFLNENFDYPVNDTLLENGWNQIGSSGSNPIRTTGAPLTFAGYPPASNGIGSAASLAASGQDLFKDAGSTISSGSAFASFLASISAAQTGGDFFFALLPSTSSTTYACRVFVRSSVNNGFFNVAITKNNESPVYGTTDFALKETHLFYVEYVFNTGSNTDDSMYLYVVPSGAPIPGVKPLVATASGFNGGQTDLPNIGRVALRQGTSGTAAMLRIDGVRLGSSWSNGELPVQLTSFTVSKDKVGNLLKWTTASELNNHYFEVQRGADGRYFDSIGMVIGAGNSSGTVEYSFIDAEPINAKAICYRLKQVDEDGKVDYSKMIMLKRENTTILLGASLLNPFNEELSVNVDTREQSMAMIVLMDLHGKIDYASQQILHAGSNKISISTDNIPDGIYVVRISANGENYVRKVVKSSS